VKKQKPNAHFTIGMQKENNSSSNSSSLPPIVRSHADELRSLIRDVSARNASHSFVIEGPHLIERAFESAPGRIKEIIFTEKAFGEHHGLSKRAERQNIRSYQISVKMAERISDTKTPQGIFAVVKMPEKEDALTKDGIVIALDDVQDPGNVGAIIRTASWFGVKQILLSKECADPYSQKVLRSTQGEIFSTNVGIRGEIKNNLVYLQQKGFQVVVATLDPGACSLYKMAFVQNVALVLGSEAHGVSKEIVRIADGQIIVPKFGAGESLNVAISAGIILSEIMRNRI
jgi:TrmH family RNA methyltransferase